MIYKNKYEITAELVGEKAFNESDAESVDRHHVITITDLDSKVSERFDFWPSSLRPVVETDEELLEAVDCFLSDADYGEYDEFYEFASEMGYDIPKELYSQFKGCKAANRKAKKLFGERYWEFATMLREEIY